MIELGAYHIRVQEKTNRKASTRDRMKWHFESRHMEGKWKITVGTNKATQPHLAKPTIAEPNVNILHEISER
jgi:hypothetical protein